MEGSMEGALVKAWKTQLTNGTSRGAGQSRLV